MIRILLALLLTLFLPSLSFRGQVPEETVLVETSGKVFQIIVTMDTDDEIWALAIDYMIDGEWMGGGEVRNARFDDPLDEKELRFWPELPEGADLSGFSCQFFLVDEPDGGPADINATAAHIGQRAVEGEIAIRAEPDGEYHVVITGSREEGYQARRADPT